ncbi:poly-gamma-glutamate hydrolase family protein [Bacillus sonorensis]|uniref:poly-gamma-glutamate hydrolase family protein n=1 Tax=Bacillus TaxID=1386 RepID=UPI0004950D99|nr:poly-gamma-glutamate hydrolase family protein [Bacillus sonorensis]MBG9915551.1 phage-related replication protein [Bacillus sonorensis]MCF7617990.1 poly-gamma-glutamate hydrolase family protein [Bacillus sonorensis]MCY7856710.1 poly-gamma-glutamate hydrolase family protein [Bacillus sonorensis]MCY8024269.1 poly-gamma-glutamate hydrolase family protein [Bacillus sonorensis]MCY8036135.1 poly-gamma-glutamate hydrolase family protein [Bacillus sonorensis]
MEPAKVSLPRRMLQCLKQCVDCNTANRFTAINRYVKILLISSVISIPSFAMAHHEYAAGQSDDRYASFEELKQNEDPSDYRIATKQAGSTMLIMAIHGGGIEPGTSEIANELSHSYSMYLFEGLKSSGNSSLHITSTNFDEPSALDMAAGHTYIISLHGYYAEDRLIKVGGTDRGRIKILVEELNKAGFTAEMLKTDDRYAGTSPDNIANKSISGLSIQLEMSTGFRRSLFGVFTLKDRASTQNEDFYRFTKLLSNFIESHYE